MYNRYDSRRLLQLTFYAKENGKLIVGSQIIVLFSEIYTRK